MKTYQENGKRYWFDWSIKSWTLINIDDKGNQIGNAEYYANKTQLIRNYPTLKFKIEIK